MCADAALPGVGQRLIEQALAEPGAARLRHHQEPAQLADARLGVDQRDRADHAIALLRDPKAPRSAQSEIGQRLGDIGFERRVEAVLARVENPVQVDDHAEIAGRELVADTEVAGRCGIAHHGREAFLGPSSSSVNCRNSVRCSR